MHETLARELAHAGVDDRIAGAALLPGRERAGVVAPAMAARPEVGVRDLGARREQLRVEVAPAELAHERLGALPAARALGQLERRQAAEVQVRTQPRGAVGGEIVVQLVVGGEAACQPARHPARPSDSPPRGSSDEVAPRTRPASAGSLPRASRAGRATPAASRTTARRGASASGASTA